MSHFFKQRVYYADTDSYGVVWHGSYIKWMEAARVEYCRDIGIDLVKLAKENDITIPVTNLNIRYKSSATLDEKLLVETSLTKLTPICATFTQLIKNEETGALHTKAEVEVVAVHNNGGLYRRLPDELRIPLEGSLECKD